MKGVSLQKFVEKMALKNLTPDIELKGKKITSPEVNRPALQLTGFFDHFDNERVQIIGNVEYDYIRQMDPLRRRSVYDRLLSEKIPCMVYCRSLMPDEDMLELCNHYGVACLVSDMTTSAQMAEIIRWLNVKLAPCITIHGVLVDVFGVGVLMMGESGIGKSEAASASSTSRACLAWRA